MTVSTGTVTVRYWAAARAAAERDHEEVSLVGGSTVADIVDEVTRDRPALARVAAAATFLVDGRSAARDRSVDPGSVVEVLPPFAGG